MKRSSFRQVVQTRITPPKAPQNIIARSGIVKLLSSSRGKKLLLVTAPAGYGKTTIVNEYISQNGISTAWVHITPDIKGIFNLLAYITGSLNRINEEYGNNILETISLIENDTEKINDLGSAISELAGMMINELLEKFTDDILIVLDDYHELDNESNVTLFIDQLIKDLPDNIHLAIISREIPKLNLTHLRAKRQIIEVTLKELSFNKEEITSLADKIYSKSLSAEEILYLESAIGGWITGIHLVIQTMENKPSGAEGQLSSIPANLFDYFAEEILNKQNSEIKDFLLKTSHLENFDAETCNSVLKINNSAGLLGYLMGKNIFLESKQFADDKGNNVVAYDYIQLFRSFLISKSKDILTTDIQQSIYYNTSLYYQSILNPEKTIDFALLTDDQEYFEKLLIKNFEEFFINGKFEKLWKWIDHIDENKLVNKKNFYYFKGVLSKYYLGNLDKAIEYLNNAIKLSENDKDENFTITATVTKVEIMLNQGKTSDALEILLRLEKTKTTELNKAKIFYYLGNINFQKNQLIKALEYSNKALELCSTKEENTITEDIYNMLGNINIIQGEFVHAIHYYELILSITRSMQKKLVVQGNLGILYSRSGKFTKARVCYEETFKILRYFSSPVFEIAVKMTEYNLIFETGDYSASILLAEKINRSALKLKNSQYIQLSYQFLGECSYYLGNHESSVKYLELAEKYINSSSETDKMLNLLLKTISKIDITLPGKSEKDLISVYDYLTSTGSHYDRSIAGFYLAKCYQMNNPETCKQYLETVFALSHEKGYFSFLFREYIRSSNIFELAGNKYKTSFMEYLAQAEEVSELNWISESYRDKLKKFIDFKHDLKILAFGGLRFILKGEEIPEKKWLRKKRKLLLSYVMIFRNQSLSKDKIVDVFFGDTPVESIDNTFHQAVSNLRTALRTDTNDTKKTANNDYILYEDKMLRLNNLYNYYSDLEDFDNLIKKANSAADNSGCTEYLLKASSLYSGNVLEGYYEDWCESLREEYKSKFIKSAEKLIELLTEQNRTDESILQAEKLNRIDNLNIAAIKAIIYCNIKQGKHNIAKSRYEKFIALYEDEIGEKPPETILNDIENLFNN